MQKPKAAAKLVLGHPSPDRARVLLADYPLAMAFALVFSGEHFVIAVFVGWTYAIVTYVVGSRLPDRWEARPRRRNEPPHPLVPERGSAETLATELTEAPGGGDGDVGGAAGNLALSATTGHDLADPDGPQTGLWPDHAKKAPGGGICAAFSRRKGSQWYDWECGRPTVTGTSRV
jgi:hypothetical protein